jgi:drug/metabolite transporter (DMT)-like permease
LSVVATTSTMQERKPITRPQAIALVFACTLLSAVGQILIKSGANALTRSSPWAMLMNLPLVAGYGLYGVMTILFIYALRDEELSFVYPIISLSYVWVAGLSVWFLHEGINGWKLLGIATIVAGVAVLGKDARK